MTRQLGKPAVSAQQAFVQTERKAHADWGRLSIRAPVASAIMHHLIHLMDKQNAVVVSQKTLAALVGCHINSVGKAVKLLRDERWINVVKLHGPGQVAAYVVNSEVAWCDTRNNKRLALFTARVVADAIDQDEEAPATPLRRVPVIYPPEEALPTGEWPEGSQAQLPGMESVVVGPPDQQLDLDDAARAAAWVDSLPVPEAMALHGRTKTPTGGLYAPTSPAWKLVAWEAAGRPIPA